MQTTDWENNEAAPQHDTTTLKTHCKKRHEDITLATPSVRVAYNLSPKMTIIASGMQGEWWVALRSLRLLGEGRETQTLWGKMD